MFQKRPLLTVVLLLVSACGDDGDREPPPELRVASLPGVYSGVFPCDGCPGIPTTVWLLMGGGYFCFMTHQHDIISRSIVSDKFLIVLTN